KKKWRDDTSRFSPGKLDYIVYSDSVMKMTGGFVLWTEDLPHELLEKHGLRAGDTREASDHLPVVADFVVR
ncbi:endonuclease, partial [bacterium]|nr:endonuclease [bacterium]